MFDEIGQKIKLLAKIICWVGIAAAVICGVVFMFQESFFGGLLIAMLGAVAAWTGSFVLYGFGELVESAMVLRDAKLQEQSVDPSFAVSTPKKPQQSGFSLTEMANQRNSQHTGTWMCKNCGRKNADSSPVCADCGASRKDSIASRSANSPKYAPAAQHDGYSLSQLANESNSKAFSGWVCKKCGRKNSDSSPICGDCGSNKKDSATVARSSQSSMGQGAATNASVEWKCQNCGRQNHSSAKFCTGCGKAK